MRGPGRTIGVQNLKKEERWRCATCKFTNDNELTECGRCRDPKKVLKEAPVPRGSSHGAMGAQKPMRFTNANAQQAKPIQKTKPVPVPQQNRGQPTIGGGGKMRTLDQLKAGETSDI